MVADEIRFDWDEANIGHIARHDVTQEEAQQALANEPLELGARYVGGEERFLSVGHTNGGRWLMVASTERGERIRVITAYDADERYIELSLRSKGESDESADSKF